ncbi:unnamed protein product [Rhodiola kirilowii]
MKGMGKRRRGSDDGSDDDGAGERPSKRGGGMSNDGGDLVKQKKTILPSMIKNKDKRAELHAKLKQEKKLEKKKKAKAREAAEKRALELGEEPPARSVPKTIENTREHDETVCQPDDEELFVGNDADEFSSVIKEDRPTKILITTCRFNSTALIFMFIIVQRGPAFIAELLTVIPNAHYYKRGTYELKKIVEYAKKKDFTSLIVVHTNRREPDALIVMGLPDGPTAHFKLSKLVLWKDIKNHGNPTSHKPEIVLNNFTTRLGHRVGRLIQSLFPQDPNFRGRRVVTFHNQRDFIFFRHHRYIFETKENKLSESKSKKDNKDSKKEKVPKEKTIARLQECGPRFTLKLISLQHGTFDTKGGEFEWVHKSEMDTRRRRLAFSSVDKETTLFFPPTSFILSAQIPRRIKMAAASTLSCCPQPTRSIRPTSQSRPLKPNSISHLSSSFTTQLTLRTPKRWTPIVSMSMEAGIGVMGTKLGMMTYFEAEGKVVPVTVVGFKEGNIVTQVKTEATDGYNAVQVGYRRIRDRKLTKPELGHLQKADVIPMRHLQEFRLQSVDGFETSQKLDFQELFKEGDLVDVAGDTIGKGFLAADISLTLLMRCLVGNIEF